MRQREQYRNKIKTNLLYYYLRGFPCLDFSFFQFKNAPTPLCLSRDKIKWHSGKNATVTPTKTLPKKQDYFPVIFQIALSTYKLDLLKKKTLINQILKIKTHDFFFLLKKKPHHTRVARVMRLVLFKQFSCFDSLFFSSKMPLHSYV